MERKRLRLLIIIIIFLAATFMIYPTLQWYFLLSPEDRSLVEITNEDMHQIEMEIEDLVNGMRRILENQSIYYSCYKADNSTGDVPSMKVAKSLEEELQYGDPVLDIRQAKYLTTGRIHQLTYKDYIFQITKSQLIAHLQNLHQARQAELAGSEEETDYSNVDYNLLARDFLSKMERAKAKRRALALIENLRSIRSSAISPGLDIAGGISLTLDVDRESLVKRITAQAKARIQQEVDEDRAFQESTRESVLNTYLAQPGTPNTEEELAEVDQEKIEEQLTRAMQIEIDRRYEEQRESIWNNEIAPKLANVTDQAIKVLQDRVNQFGVSEPIIEKGIQGGYITVSLPGATNRDNAIAVVTRAGNLEFRLVDEETMATVESKYPEYINRNERVIVNKSISDIRTMFTLAGIPNQMNDFGFFIDVLDIQDKKKLQAFIDAYHLEPEPDFFKEQVKTARFNYNLDQIKGKFSYAEEMLTSLNNRLEYEKFKGEFRFANGSVKPDYYLKIEVIKNGYVDLLQRELQAFGFEVTTPTEEGVIILPMPSPDAIENVLLVLYQAIDEETKRHSRMIDEKQLKLQEAPVPPEINIGFDLVFVPLTEEELAEKEAAEEDDDESSNEEAMETEAENEDDASDELDTIDEVNDKTTLPARYKEDLATFFSDYHLTPDDHFINVDPEGEARIGRVHLETYLGTYIYWKKNNIKNILAGTHEVLEHDWKFVAVLEKLLLEDQTSDMQEKPLLVDVEVLSEEKAFDLVVKIDDPADHNRLYSFISQNDMMVNKEFKYDPNSTEAKVALSSTVFLNDLVDRYKNYVARSGMNAGVGKRNGYLMVGDESTLMPFKSSSDPFSKQEGWVIVLNHLSYTNSAGEKVYVTITGESHLAGASPDMDPNTGQPRVAFQFNGQGADNFYLVTQDHVGERLAIVLDGEVKSAPNIRTGISGGRGVIEGRFSVEEVQNLVGILEAGNLPASLIVESENIIEPSLGARNIEYGSYAALIGVLLLLIFMILYYRFSGFIANIALIFNWLLLFAVLSSLKFTLTLSGIAGMVLTLAMAVDANVIIFERIREELRAGKTTPDAIDQGFKRAFLTILDANITTVLAALVLTMIDISIVKGFGITLFWGIIISMITALFIVRFILDFIVSVFRLKKLSI